MSGFQREMDTKYNGVCVEISEKKLIVSNHSEEIREAMIRLLTQRRAIAIIKSDVAEGVCKALRTEELMAYIRKLASDKMMPRPIMKVSIKEITFYGNTEEDIHKSVSFVLTEVIAEHLDISRMNLIDSQNSEFDLLLELSRTKHKGLLHIQKTSPSRYDITGPSKLVRDIKAQLSEIIKKKSTICEDVRNIDTYHTRVLHIAFQDKLRNLEASMSEGHVKFEFSPNGRRLSITANKEFLEKAKKEIFSITKSIQESEMHIQEPSLAAFLGQELGAALLKTTEDKFKAVICPMISTSTPGLPHTTGMYLYIYLILTLILLSSMLK